MLGTGEIIQNGVETFAPVINRTEEIGLELVNYFMYIGIGILGIRILREAVKHIINYLKYETENTMQSRRRRRRRQRRMKRAIENRFHSREYRGSDYNEE